MNDWYEYEFNPGAQGRPRFSIAGVIFVTFLIGVLCALGDYELGRKTLVIVALYFVSHAITLYVFVALLRKPKKTTPSSRTLLDANVKGTSHDTHCSR